ncbi:hypothetical protein QFZ37_000779 [Chryseobacterium ginsenosidimutans]|uniref:STM3941 family protein n=1 Tax=Chryseobacterium ginsenosidimutans TaxID=687846 RepID=UPI0027895E16|nr:STM3941 family protein [Chryseobacterium ginsenosidimutans]MDQ0592410.1 hypothetical protein [Chryseobacterium ginsenosidimutans]
MNKIDEQIEIPLSKVKITMLFCGALAFILIGLWFMISPPEVNHSNRRAVFFNPVFLFFIGLISVLFFGCCTVFIFRKLFDTKPGLIINQNGIIDNSSGLSAELVLWSDIKEIKIITIHNQKLIMVILNNPHDYLNKVTNKLKKKGMEINYKWYDAPISISANSLQTNYKDLHRILLEKMQQYRNGNV